MAVLGRQLQAVDALEVGDFFQRRRGERRLVLERMQGHAFEQIAERQVEVFGQSLEHLEQAFFQPHTGLHALDFPYRILHGDLRDTGAW